MIYRRSHPSFASNFDRAVERMLESQRNAAVQPKGEMRCIWCEALEGDHSAPVCSGPDGRGHHFRKTPWVTPNDQAKGRAGSFIAGTSRLSDGLCHTGG